MALMLAKMAAPSLAESLAAALVMTDVAVVLSMKTNRLHDPASDGGPVAAGVPVSPDVPC